MPKNSFVHVSQFLMVATGASFPTRSGSIGTLDAGSRGGAAALFAFSIGGGGLQCIGEGFAWTEGLLVIATLASAGGCGSCRDIASNSNRGSRFGRVMGCR
jgi:hypothetical protein